VLKNDQFMVGISISTKYQAAERQHAYHYNSRDTLLNTN